MKLILVGYPGSRKVREASRFLVDKYFPMEQTWLEYTGDIEGWSKFVSDHLKTLSDEWVIFTLDDYLISDYSGLLPTAKEIEGAECVKLCYATDEENESYPITTQYTLWKREYLIELLSHVSTPWEFEIEGSRLHKEWGRKALFIPTVKYFTNSSLSKKWDGVRLDGLNEEDAKEVQKRL